MVLPSVIGTKKSLVPSSGNGTRNFINGTEWHFLVDGNNFIDFLFVSLVQKINFALVLLIWGCA